MGACAQKAVPSETVLLTVERLAWRGRGVARQAGGPTVLLAPGVLPGETVRARIIARKQDYWEARAEAVLEPSPLRRPHPCPLAGRCGGSAFGILEADAALGLKAELLRHTLERSLGPYSGSAISNGLTIMPSPQPWGYRFRAQVEIAAGQAHFRAAASHELVPLARCLLFADSLNAQLRPTVQRLAPGRHTLAASPLDGAVLADTDPGTLALALPFCGTVLIPPGVFFQANQLLNPTLIETVASWVEDCPQVVDLFAGAGNFALPLAAQGHQVLAVEGQPEGVVAGRSNADRLGLQGQVRWLTANLHRGVPAAVGAFAPQAAVVDPPRIGARGLALALASIPSLARLVWISCDVVNSARDLRPLLERGFVLDRLVLFDMFPGTWHMEVAMLLSRTP